MTLVAARKCVQHPAREAVARCPSCSRDFCRECTVEHDGLLLCASCLAKQIAAAAVPSQPASQRIMRMLTTAACIGLLWVAFYFVGSMLKLIPPDVHEGTVWRMPK